MESSGDERFARRVRAAEAALAAGRWEEAERLTAELERWLAARAANKPEDTATVAELRRRLNAGPFRSAGGPVDPKTAVRRHVSVRYYSRVRPGTAYPMLVVLSRLPLADADLERAAKQTDRDAVPLRADQTVDVIPVLANCTVTPDRHALAVTGDLSEARFEVTAESGGTVPRATVLVQQRGETVASIPLDIRARRTIPAILWGVLAVLVPVLLKVNQLDLESSISDGGGKWREFIAAGTDLVPWWAFGLALAAVAGWMWWRSRPHASNFFDVTTVPGPDPDVEDRYERGRAALMAGDAVGGLAILDEITRAAPDFQPAWLLTADWHFERGNRGEALSRYRRGLALGPSTARRFAQAATAAAAVDDLDAALGWVASGLGSPDAGSLRALLLYNRACYLARRGEDEAGLTALTEAVAAGLPDPTAVHTDPDLAPLRRLPAFAARFPTPSR